MSKCIKNENGIYVELPRDKIKFESKEAELIFDLSLENDELQQENQKYKEVIDKAINLIVKETKSMPMNGCKIRLIELLDILKEVE